MRRCRSGASPATAAWNHAVAHVMITPSAAEWYTADSRERRGPAQADAPGSGTVEHALKIAGDEATQLQCHMPAVGRQCVDRRTNRLGGTLARRQQGVDDIGQRRRVAGPEATRCRTRHFGHGQLDSRPFGGRQRPAQAGGGQGRPAARPGDGWCRHPRTPPRVGGASRGSGARCLRAQRHRPRSQARASGAYSPFGSTPRRDGPNTPGATDRSSRMRSCPVPIWPKTTMLGFVRSPLR